MKVIALCQVCKSKFEAKTHNQIYCCKKCRAKSDYIRNIKKRRSTSLEYRNNNKEKQSLNRIKWRNDNISKGMCHQCGKIPKYKNILSCCSCYFKQAGAQHLGSRKFGTDLEKLYLEQGRICTYTLSDIEPGTMSLDHIKPKSRGGDNSIHNVQWILKELNVVKNSMTHEEFINLCKLIARNFV